MPAAQKWLTEIYENSAEGVSSAVTPELLPPSQLAWGKNIRTRGAKPGTRPSLKYMGTLPSGLVQGVSYFGVQGGMGVISIGGHIYRLRIGLNSATFEEIALPWFNSGIIKQVYMQQTVETLVIQDGQSNPILYDGSTAERSVPEDGGVPLGRQMAYGNGRLWVAINGKELVAGDIRSNVIGSELLFTETNYLSSGGTFFFPEGITGLNFIATTGTSDYGALLIFGRDTCDALRADITYRDLWAQTPGFITSVLRHTGCASHWSLAQVNQDLYWRDSAGGIRSIRSSLADESGAGNAPISREVSRLTDYDSQKLLPFCSTISFNNRLLMTSSPRLNKRGGITWGSLISLDFAPISTMRGKSFPSYDGQWDGINFTHLFQGQFNGRSRAFAVTLNDDNSNSLWEIMADGRGAIGDETIECSDGSSTNGITCSVEYGRRSFGISGVRKRLERCDVYLWAMRGDVDLSVYWRADNNQKWQSWGDAVEVCAKDGDPEVPGASTHVWRNLLPQQRPQIKTFTIPSNIDDITKYSLANGFEFQIRLVWTGQVHIYKTILHSQMLDGPAWAMRDLLTASCLYNDVTGNQVTYQVPVTPCPFIMITLQPQSVVVTLDSDEPVVAAVIFRQYDGPFVYPACMPSNGYDYYKTETVGGTNTVKAAPVAGDPHLRTCSLTDPPAAYGLVSTVWSGSHTYGMDCSESGSINAVLNRRGTLGAYDSPGVPGVTTNLTGASFDEVFAQLGAYRGIFLSGTYSEFGNDAEGTFARIFATQPTPGGFYPGSLGGAFGVIYCPGGSVTAILSNRVTVADLGVPEARSGGVGSAAQTQTTGDFDTGTRTHEGNYSEAEFTLSVDSTRDQITGNFTFSVTPTVGSPYTYYSAKDFAISGGTLVATVGFPMFPNAIIEMTAWAFSYQKSISEDFSSYDEADTITSLTSSQTWKYPIFYDAPAPNTDCWDDFEDFPEDQVSDQIELTITGHRWASSGTYSSVDYTTCFDDFEGYIAGDITSYAQGTGWVAAGTIAQVVYNSAWDDYESYAVGPITDYDYTSFNNFWVGDGSVG